MKEETDSLSITELVWTVFICAFCAIIHEKFLTLSLYVMCILEKYSVHYVHI